MGENGWKVLGGLPANKKIYNFMPENESFFSEGLVINFFGKDINWIGNFKDPKMGLFFTKVFRSSHDENYFCVIVGGQVYLFNIYTPEIFDTPTFKPIIDALLIKEINAIIFISFMDVFIMGQNGFRNIKSKIFIEYSKIISYSKGKLILKGFNLAKGKTEKIFIYL